MPHKECDSSILSREMVVTLVLKFVSKNFPKENITGIMVTGSYANHTATPESDIDIIIVMSSIDSISINQIIYANHIIQPIIIPLRLLSDLVFFQNYWDDRALHSMIKNGYIIYDKDGNLNAAKKLAQNFTPKMNDDEIMSLRKTFSVHFNNLQRASSKENGIFSLFEIIKSIASLYSGVSGAGKHVAAAVSPKVKDRLIFILKSYLNGTDITAINKSLLDFINPFGGLIDEYSSYQILQRKNKNEILIYLNETTCISRDNILILHIMNNICYKNNTNFYSFYESCDSFMKQGLYIYAFGEEQNIRELYFDLNRYIESKQTTIPNVLFPIQSNLLTGYRFGSKYMFKHLKFIFAELHISFKILKAKHIDLNIIYFKTIHSLLCNENINGIAILSNTLKYLGASKIEPDSLMSSNTYEYLEYPSGNDIKQIYTNNKNNIEEILSNTSLLSKLEPIIAKIHLLINGEYSHASSPYNDYRQIHIMRNIILHIGGILLIHSYYKQVILTLLYLHLRNKPTYDI